VTAWTPWPPNPAPPRRMIPSLAQFTPGGGDYNPRTDSTPASVALLRCGSSVKVPRQPPGQNPYPGGNDSLSDRRPQTLVFHAPIWGSLAHSRAIVFATPAQWAQ